MASGLDPTDSDEYQALQGELEDAETRINPLRQDVGRANTAALEVEEEAERLLDSLSQREQEVAAREAAVTVVEQQIEATSIEQSTWTVGRDTEPGTYRTSTAVFGQCYWGIYRAGTNGGDIIDNDIVTGGFPTVQLSEGQEFTNVRMRHLCQAVTLAAAAPAPASASASAST